VNDPRGVMEKLLPTPRSVELRDGEFCISERTMIVAAGPAGEEDRRFAAERLAEMIGDEFGFRPEVRMRAGEGAPAIVVADDAGALTDKHCTCEEVPPAHEEGYVLEVGPEAAVLQGADPAGLFYAAMTFRQLLTRSDGGATAACIRIADYPHYRRRGFQFDSGRAPNSPAKMKRILRICAAFKLNFVVFREGDDELNAVRYRTNKLGAENPRALTMEEVADLVEYAGHLGVTVIPEIESLGHSQARCLAYPDLVEGGIETSYEGIGIHVRKANLLPCDPRSYELLRSIYEEWLSVLPSPLLHLGLDEVRLSAEVQAAHFSVLLKVIDELSAAIGREIIPLVWSDAPPTPPPDQRRVVRVPWCYGCPGHGEIGLENEHLLHQGFDVLSQAACPQQVFMAGGSTALHVPYEKPSWEGAVRNLAEWSRWGKDRDNFIGLYAGQWGGNMTDLWLEEFLTAADFGWQPPAAAPQSDEQRRRVGYHLARIPDASDPPEDQIDRPVWDGIYLHGTQCEEDILTGKRNPDLAGR